MFSDGISGYCDRSSSCQNNRWKPVFSMVRRAGRTTFWPKQPCDLHFSASVDDTETQLRPRGCGSIPISTRCAVTRGSKRGTRPNESGLRRAKVGSPLDARPHRQGTVSVDSGGPLAYWVAKIARLLVCLNHVARVIVNANHNAA